jgi:hypothetical protein
MAVGNFNSNFNFNFGPGSSSDTVASSVYSPTVYSIMRRALRQCNAIESGDTPGAQEISDAFDALNAMVAGWQATGLHVWTETEGVLFTQPGQIKYALGGTNTTQSCTDANWTQASLSAAAAQGATTISLVSATGISTGDNIGVMLSNNALFWTTVNGVPSGNNVPLVAALPSTAPLNAIVIDYPIVNKLTRPLRIPNARRFYLPSQIETELTIYARLDYRDQPNKYTGGTITTFFYDPQQTIGYQWLWPAPQDSLSACKFTFYAQLGDFATPSDTPNFPQEWLQALTWGLADELVPEYGVGQARAQMIAQKAAYWLDIAHGWDREPESYLFGVDFDQSGRW